MIAVTCRNGKHFSIDPDAIERVETGNDTVLHMADGAKYVLDLDLDELLTAMRDHRAAAVVTRNRRLVGAGALAATVPPAPARAR